jgi:uncharacterized protein YdeI (YjbR/CyaY-like superfamily)
MMIDKALYVKDRKGWRVWLSKNHRKEKVIWLVYYRKSSGKPRIPYNDAVEEALCYGWIDGTVKKIDGERFAQRFTPRRPGSNVSQMNIERIHRLIAERRMTKAGLDAVVGKYDNRSKDEKVVIPKDILSALRKDAQVWRNFEDFPEHYKKIRIAYIEGYRNRGREEFQKRLGNFIKKTRENKMIGCFR